MAAADKVSLWKLGLDGKYQCLTTPQAPAPSAVSSTANSTMENITGDVPTIPIMAT